MKVGAFYLNVFLKRIIDFFSEWHGGTTFPFGRPLRITQCSYVSVPFEVTASLYNGPPFVVASRRQDTGLSTHLVQHTSFPIAFSDCHPNRVAEEASTAPSTSCFSASSARTSRPRPRGKEPTPNEVHAHVQKYGLRLGATI